jgi:O-antigen/teichoic acid export membrane protein
MSLTGMLSRFSEGITDLVIGRFNTTTSVGIFSRGFGAVLFIKNLMEQAVGPVVLPHLSEVKRSGGSIAKEYLKAINLLVVVIWPVMAVVSAASYPLINLLFGDQWGMAVPLTSILALWAIFTYAHYFGNAGLISVNQEKLMFQIGLVTFIFRLAVVLAVAAKSLEYIAWAMVISGVFEAVVYVWALNKALNLKLKDLWLTLFPNMIIAVCCWLVTKVIDYAIVFESQSAFYSIAIIAPTLTVVWIGLLFAMKHPALDVITDLLQGIRSRFA